MALWCDNGKKCRFPDLVECTQSGHNHGDGHPPLSVPEKCRKAERGTKTNWIFHEKVALSSVTSSLQDLFVKFLRRYVHIVLVSVSSKQILDHGFVYWLLQQLTCVVIVISSMRSCHWICPRCYAFTSFTCAGLGLSLHRKSGMILKRPGALFREVSLKAIVLLWWHVFPLVSSFVVIGWLDALEVRLHFSCFLISQLTIPSFENKKHYVLIHVFLFFTGVKFPVTI